MNEEKTHEIDTKKNACRVCTSDTDTADNLNK